MDKSKNIFIKIDEFIFQRIDLLKADGSFQKINDVLSGLEEEQQKLFAQLLTFSLLIIPFIIALIFWWGNHNIKKNIEVKNQILEQIASLSGNRDTLVSVSSTFVSPVPISDKGDLDNKIRNLMSSANIDQSKVSVMNFTQLSTSNSLSKVEAVLSFKNFGTSDFSNFMRALVEQQKFKVEGISLYKTHNSNLLQGEVSLLHLGKSPGF